ncbi:14224_t:CDS:2 [Gigaspora margarita]|uniref:14224_t:CDS:1 n=1 Tax=Gigaspora margarita TaxID=4874 RepID=A0ABN7VDS9_GIGMA|nr:14224_t:CDS:2 [Gigaspora margarita]
MNYIRIEDGDSGNIYDKIYDPRKVFAVEFFAWRLAQGTESEPYQKEFNETHMDPTSEKYLVYLYENLKVCEKLFPQSVNCLADLRCGKAIILIIISQLRLMKVPGSILYTSVMTFVNLNCCSQAYEAKLKILVLDCPAHPFCRVREVFDLDIPYKNVAKKDFKLFEHLCQHHALCQFKQHTMIAFQFTIIYIRNQF